MLALLIAVLCLTPLALAPGWFLYFDITPKVVFFLLGTALVLTHRRCWKGLDCLWGSSQGRLFLTLCALQIASLWLSTVLSGDFGLSYAGTNWRRFGAVTQTGLMLFLAALACELAVRPAGLVPLLRGISLVLLLLSGYGLLQYLQLDPLLGERVVQPGYDRPVLRPPSTFGLAPYFAAFASPALFLTAAQIATETSRGWRWAGGAAVTLGGVTLLLGGTRAAYLGLGAGLLLVGGLLRFRPRRRHGTAAAVAVVAVALFSASPAGSFLRARVSQWRSDMHGGTRLHLVRDVPAMIVSRWATGHGPELFPVQFPRFQSLEFARAYPEHYQESPHNVLLDAVVAQGVAAAGILVGFAQVAVQSCRQSGTPPGVAWMLGALAASVVFHGFFSLTLATALYFFLPVALLAAQSAPASPGFVVPRGLRAASLLAALLLASFAVRLAVFEWRLTAVQAALDQGRLDDARIRYRRALAWRPFGVTADFWFSRRLSEAAQTVGMRPALFREALESAERAARAAEDRHNACLHLAVLLTNLEDPAPAEQQLRRCVLLAPQWYRPHWVLAELLRRQGRLPEAAAAARLALERSGASSEPVQRTLDTIQRELAAKHAGAGRLSTR